MTNNNDVQMGLIADVYKGDPHCWIFKFRFGFVQRFLLLAHGMTPLVIWYSRLVFFGQRSHGFHIDLHLASPLGLQRQQQLNRSSSSRGEDYRAGRGLKVSRQSLVLEDRESMDLVASEQFSSRITRRKMISAATLAFGIGFPIEPSKALPWQATPINKRTGVTVFDAELAGYTVSFVTYLSRFLLTFDASCQRWWYDQEARFIPKLADANQVKVIQNDLFASFAASVEVGLQDFRGTEGPRQLFEALIARYCDVEPINDRQASECKEARRQVCLLFALMEANQPVEYLTRQLAAIDNGTISEVVIESPGSGYAPGYGPPEVRFPPPAAGGGYELATGRAVLTPTGKILRIDLVNRGKYYAKAPEVIIAPPSTTMDGKVTTQARAKAMLFRSGPNKGCIERIQLTDPGEGYVENQTIDITISPPESSKKRGDTATAVAILEYEVSAIKMTKNGSGYAVERPVEVWVEPPPITARVNLNDPLVARVVSADDLLPQSTIPDEKMKRLMPSPSDPGSVTSQVYAEARKASGCVGRECYDSPVIAKAYPSRASSQRSIFDTFRKNEDKKLKNLSASSAGDLPEPINFVSGELPEMLALLPAGIGLEFNTELKRYELAIDPEVAKGNTGGFFSSRSRRRIDPDFGPRGRAPIEREVSLSLDAFLRFMFSGAICCSGVHLALTPIDVVKTKVQTDPTKYSGFSAFKKVFNEGGIDAFFQGWQPTFLGYFFWGGLSYALTELVRRILTDQFGPVDPGLEIAIILFAASMGAFVGSFVICPFESVRIRSVSQANYAPTIWEVFLRMYKEEGLKSLFAAVPLFLGKEVPFAMAKFTVFDLSTLWLYQQFPAAREDLQLSLLVSLVGGTMGGIAAAIVSNPADVTISVLKKAKNDIGLGGAAAMIIEDGGVPALFTGLPLRMVFYSLVVSLQFLVYDSVRFALGIGADDLKQYLNVLGGALSETGGPI